MADLDKLDDQDSPACTPGQAARMVDVQEAFLRSLDTAGLLRPPHHQRRPLTTRINP